MGGGFDGPPPYILFLTSVFTKFLLIALLSLYSVCD